MRNLQHGWPNRRNKMSAHNRERRKLRRVEKRKKGKSTGFAKHQMHPKKEKEVENVQ